MHSGQADGLTYVGVKVSLGGGQYGLVIPGKPVLSIALARSRVLFAMSADNVTDRSFEWFMVVLGAKWDAASAAAK